MVQTTLPRATARPRPLEQRADDRRREILAAAARLFRSRGLAATGMRDIAGALGMAVGNLYYYFASKEELLTFCQEEGLAGLSALLAAVRRLALPAHESLGLLLAGHVLQVTEATPGTLAHLALDLPPATEAGSGEPQATALRRARRDYEHSVRRLIEEGIAAGTLRAIDPKLATLALLGAVNWTARWYDPSGSRSASEIAIAFADQLVRGLLAPGVEPPQLDGERIRRLVTAIAASRSPADPGPAETSSR